MTQAIRFYETGGPEVLRLENVAVGDPGPGQARVRHSYIALNFIDVYFRCGRYPLALPNGLGSDAVGVVEPAVVHRIRADSAARRNFRPYCSHAHDERHDGPVSVPSGLSAAGR